MEPENNKNGEIGNFENQSAENSPVEQNLAAPSPSIPPANPVAQESVYSQQPNTTVPQGSYPAPNQVAPQQSGPSLTLNISGGAGMTEPLPPELRGWNWGGFFFTWIWAVAHNTYLGLLALIPAINLAMAIVLGIKGNEWAWQNRKFESVEQFKAVQRRWALWGLGVFIISLALGFLIFWTAAKNADSLEDSVTTQTTFTSTTESDNATLSDYYEDNLGEYRIRPPKNWTINEDQSYGEDVSFFSNLSDLENGLTFTTNINVMIDNLTSEPTLASYASSNKSNIAKTIDDYTVISEENISINSNKAVLVESTYSHSGTTMHIFQLYAVSGKTGYAITATALDSAWNNHESVLSDSLKSFELGYAY